MQNTSTPFPLLRTFLSSFYLTSRFFVLNYFITLAGVGLTIAGFAQDVTLGVLGLIVSVAAIIVTFAIWYRAVRDYYIQPLAPIKPRDLSLSRRLQGSNYKLLPRRGVPEDALLTSIQINDALFRGVSSALKVQSETFRSRHSAPVRHVLLRERKNKGGVLFNGKKVRLLSDPLLDDNGSLIPTHIQPTHYFDTLWTNDTIDISLRSHSDRSEFDGRKFCFPDNEIPECSQSTCANQIGASTIAITSDDNLVVLGQSAANVFSKRKWAPSGSGSADWKDVGQFTDLQQFVKHFARRELVEECGLTIDDVAWLRIFAYGRLLDRGGLPQFFCLAKLNCAYDKVNITGSERRLIDYHKPVYYGGHASHSEAMRASIKELRKNEDLFSSVLWWSFELLSALPEDSLEKAFY
jgi:hypothetical protein